MATTVVQKPLTERITDARRYELEARARGDEVTALAWSMKVDRLLDLLPRGKPWTQ